MTWDKPPEGFSLCLVQQCPRCNGTGHLVSTYCAANDMPGGGVQVPGSMFNSGSTTSSPCPDCIRGFHFVRVDPLRTFEHWLQSVLEPPKPVQSQGWDQSTKSRDHAEEVQKARIRQLLRQLVVRATEEQMTEKKDD